MTDTPAVPARRGAQSGKKPLPINFRPREADRENIDKIRAKLPWVASDADAIRYGLAAGVEQIEHDERMARRALSRPPTNADREREARIRERLGR